MKAYHNLPDETSKTIDKDNFIHTGDVGYYDTEGKFFIVERIKELIKVKGFQVRFLHTLYLCGRDRSLQG